MDSLCQQLRLKRLQKGLQQKEVAYHLKLSNAAYSKIENGITNISVDIAIRIAEILEIPVSDLLNCSNATVNASSHYPGAAEGSTASFQMNQEKLLNNQLKLFEQLINLLVTQNETFRELAKTLRSYQ